MLKRFVILALLTGLFLSACVPATAPTQSAATGAEATPAPITIDYLNINSESFGGPQVDALIASFQASYPHITVEPKVQADYVALVQNVETSIAGGNPPDVVQIAYPYLNYVGNNLPFIPVSELVEKYGSPDYLAQFPQNILDIPVVNGQQIGMAYSLSNPVVYYNADLMAAAGLDPDNPPTTLEGWREAAQVIRAQLNLPTINYGYNEDNWTIEGIIASNGGQLLVCNEGQWQAGFDSAEAIEGLQTWADIIASGQGLNAFYSEGRQAFLAGEVVVYITSIASRAGLQRDAAFDLRAARYPSFGDKPVRIPGGGNMLVVFATDPARQEAAWQFVQHLTSPEGFTEWTKGTGYVPLITSLTEDPRYLADFVAENPIQQVGVDQLENVITWTSFPGENGLAAGRALFEAVESTLGGQTTAADALPAAAATVNELIAGQSCTN